MKHLLRPAALAFSIAATAAATAQASPATDLLSKCLADSSSGKDRVVFVRWLFDAIAVHPQLKDMATIPPATRDANSKAAVKVMERLLLSDCRKETVAAVRADGMPAIRTGFEVFGRVAMTELSADPGVAAEFDRGDRYSDSEKWAALAREIQAKK